MEAPTPALSLLARRRFLADLDAARAAEAAGEPVPQGDWSDSGPEEGGDAAAPVGPGAAEAAEEAKEEAGAAEEGDMEGQGPGGAEATEYRD